MTHTNPEIEKQLDTLSELCCQTLNEMDGAEFEANGAESALEKRGEALLKAMLMSGFARQDEINMCQEVESRAKAKCPEIAIHRGTELAALTQQLQKKLDSLERWESDQPEKNEPPKAANISSATDR